MTRFRQLRLSAFAALLATSLLRCGGDNTNPPPPPDDASQIEGAGGNGQIGMVGQPLANPLVVLVTNESGVPVEGVSVSWAAQGAGSVSATTTETGADGRASVVRVLGPDPGEQTTTASAGGLEGSPVTFTATATTTGGGGAILITTNPPVSALSGEVFDPTVQPVVQVTGDGGAPLVGVEVTASLASGSGTLEGNTGVTTDAAGVARFGDLGISGSGSHTLQFAAGDNTVTSSPVDVAPLPPEATTGKWGPVVDWNGVVPLHMSLLPSGKILAWGKHEHDQTSGSKPRLWDPTAGSPATATVIPIDTMLFCSDTTCCRTAV